MEPVSPSEDRPARLERSKPIFLVVASIGVSLVLAWYFPYYAQFFVKDAPSPDISDLTLETLVVEDADNAYIDLKQAIAVLAISEEGGRLVRSFVDGTSTESLVEIEEILRTNARAITLFREASSKQIYQEPQWSGQQTITHGTNPDVSLNNGKRSLVRLVAADVRVRSLKGDHDGAVRSAIQIIKMGALLCASQNEFTTFLMGKVFQRIGYNSLFRLIETEPISLEGLRESIVALEALPSSEQGWISGAKIDFLRKVSYVDALASGGPLFGQKDEAFGMGMNRYLFQPNRVKSAFAESLRTEIVKIRSPYDLTTKEARTYLIGNPYTSVHRVTYRFIPNAYGKNLVDFWGDVFDQDSDLRALGSLRTLALAGFAQREYALLHGAYADDLTKLVPDHLSAAPLDPFSEGNMIGYDERSDMLFSQVIKMELDGRNAVTLKSMISEGELKVNLPPVASANDPK